MAFPVPDVNLNRRHDSDVTSSDSALDYNLSNPPEKTRVKREHGVVTTAILVHAVVGERADIILVSLDKLILFDNIGEVIKGIKSHCRICIFISSFKCCR